MSVKPRDLLMCAAALGLLGITIPAGAEDREVVEETTVSSDGATVRKVSTVMKSKVIIQDDEPAGQVTDFVFSDGGCIEYIVASYEDEYYVIPFSAATMRYGQNIVFVDITPTQFRDVQFFGANNWPDFYASGYQQQVFTAFGVNAIRNDIDVAARGRGNRGRDRDGDRARDRADDARDRADDARDRGKDRTDDARDRKDDARENANDARDRAKDRAEEERERAKDRAEEKDRPKAADRDAKPAPKPKADAPKPPAPKAEGKNPTPLPKNALPNPPAPKKPAPKAPQK